MTFGFEIIEQLSVLSIKLRVQAPGPNPKTVAQKASERKKRNKQRFKELQRLQQENSDLVVIHAKP